MPIYNSVRGTLGPLGKGGSGRAQAILTVSPAVNSQTVYDLSTTPLIITTPGEYKITPSGGNFFVQAWGGGGYGGNYGGWGSSSDAGAGGFSSGIINTLLLNSTFTVIVGDTGKAQNITNQVGYGAGHTSNPPGGGTGDMRYSGGGGGFTGIFTGSATVHDSNGSISNSTYATSGVQARSVLIAGGGGGGGCSSQGGYNNQYRGGAGGGVFAQGGWSNNNTYYPDSAGKQTTQGTWYASGNWTPTLPTNWSGTRYMMGTSGEGESYGGGGGGGYWGGACSGHTCPANCMMGGAGGGSGYLNPTYVLGGSTVAGEYRTPPSQSDTRYVSTKGLGGYLTTGTSGAGGGVGETGMIIFTNMPDTKLLAQGTTSGTAALSAWSIKKANPSATSGVYWINVNGTAKQIYCDMSGDEGGWMRILNGASTTSPQISQNTAAAGDPSTGRGKLSDADIRWLIANAPHEVASGGTTTAHIAPIFRFRSASSLDFFMAWHGAFDSSVSRSACQYSVGWDTYAGFQSSPNSPTGNSGGYSGFYGSGLGGNYTYAVIGSYRDSSGWGQTILYPMSSGRDSSYTGSGDTNDYEIYLR